METFEQYGLINQQKWTEFLKSLQVGTHTFVFPSIANIRSCKSIGYSLNTDRLGRLYYFKTDKSTKRVEITVKAS